MSFDEYEELMRLVGEWLEEASTQPDAVRFDSVALEREDGT